MLEARLSMHRVAERGLGDYRHHRRAENPRRRQSFCRPSSKQLSTAKNHVGRVRLEIHKYAGDWPKWLDMHSSRLRGCSLAYPDHSQAYSEDLVKQQFIGRQQRRGSHFHSLPIHDSMNVIGPHSGIMWCWLVMCMPILPHAVLQLDRQRITG